MYVAIATHWNIRQLSCTCSPLQKYTFASYVIYSICDRASEKGPSGHIKFDHLFQICSIITKNIFKELTRFFYHK